MEAGAVFLAQGHASPEEGRGLSVGKIMSSTPANTRIQNRRRRDKNKKLLREPCSLRPRIGGGGRITAGVGTRWLARAGGVGGVRRDFRERRGDRGRGVRGHFRCFCDRRRYTSVRDRSGVSRSLVGRPVPTPREASGCSHVAHRTERLVAGGKNREGGGAREQSR